MKINRPHDPIQNAGSSFPLRDATQAPARAPQPEPAAPAPKRDSVEISAEGRAKAASATPDVPASLSSERAEEIRSKILSGAYNSAEMAGEVAKKILKSGDL